MPRIAAALRARRCELRGDAASRAIVGDLKPASEADWDTEYLDLILSVALVPSLDAALAFIARHSTGLAEAIVTEDYRAARRFLAEVDAAAVFVNASTRFTDGYEFGFGAEVGISTNRLHALGLDAFRDFHLWKEHAALFALADVIVVTRPPAPARLTTDEIPLAAREAFWYDSGSGVFHHQSGRVLRLQHITALDISAARIRANVAAGRSIRFLVPPLVEAYNAAHRLYR